MTTPSFHGRDGGWINLLNFVTDAPRPPPSVLILLAFAGRLIVPDILNVMGFEVCLSFTPG